MSFLGSIAAPLRRILAGYAREIKGPVLLPCAGNFTVGAALRSGGYTGLIEGCDITLYTSALGAAIEGKPMRAALKQDCPDYLQCFLDFSTPRHFAATVAMMLELRQVWKNKNIWHRRVLTNNRRAWPQLMEKTLIKLDAYIAHLTQGNPDTFVYHAECATSFLERSDKASSVFIAPPTFGSRDYINQERMLAASVDWDAPQYKEISFQDVDIYKVITSFARWMIIMERPLPEIEKLLGDPVAVVHKGRKSITYAYAGQAKKKFVTRAYLPSVSPGPIFPGNSRLTSKETPGIMLMNKQQTVRLNELFMSSRVDYFLADVALSCALCMDGKIIGKLDFNLTKHDWAFETDEGASAKQIYLRSDLAVPSIEPRLAKLVLLLCQSHEVKRLIDGKFDENFGYAVTTAFSRNPVSMKYRGIFKLHKRLDDPEQSGYRLNYYGRLGLHSMSEAYAIWQKKYK